MSGRHSSPAHASRGFGLRQWAGRRCAIKHGAQRLRHTQHRLRSRERVRSPGRSAKAPVQTATRRRRLRLVDQQRAPAESRRLERPGDARRPAADDDHVILFRCASRVVGRCVAGRGHAFRVKLQTTAGGGYASTQPLTQLAVVDLADHAGDRGRRPLDELRRLHPRDRVRHEGE
eukprot:6574415-Prymnesium_polylepis.1